MKKRTRPISLSTIVKGQLAALAKTRPESSSVELTRNAKGDTQIKVSVSMLEGETIDATSARAQEIYDALGEKYPRPS